MGADVKVLLSELQYHAIQHIIHVLCFIMPIFYETWMKYHGKTMAAKVKQEKMKPKQTK